MLECFYTRRRTDVRFYVGVFLYFPKNYLVFLCWSVFVLSKELTRVSLLECFCTCRKIDLCTFWNCTFSIASNHVLRRLYHEKEACGYNLRTRPHNFALPVKDDTNFVSRSLYAELKS